jgi:hypothetical protein
MINTQAQASGKPLFPAGHELTSNKSKACATAKNKNVATKPTARRITSPVNAETLSRKRQSMQADTRIREASVKAATVPFPDQPTASAAAGIQALAPMAAPGNPPAFHENRPAEVEFMPFKVGLFKP